MVVVVVAVAKAGAASTGILVSRLYFCSLLISNTKARKPVVTVGASQKWKTGPVPCDSAACTANPRVKNRSSLHRRPPQYRDGLQVLISSPTVSTNTPQSESRKNSLKGGKCGRNRRLCAQLLGQFIQQPVQILVVLADLFYFEYRMQNRRMVLATELASNFRE